MEAKTTKATSTAYYHFILICVKMSAALSIIIFVNTKNSEKGEKKYLNISMKSFDLIDPH